MNIGSRLQSYNDHSLNGSPTNSAVGCAFSTYDHDVDNYPDSCAVEFHGGWWYNYCINAINPNGLYGGPEKYGREFMIYGSDSGDAHAAITMMFKQS
ncbi:hypothetical protein DPMN_157059 [Dreissena polymorpha]|uniref:Fibrinogen C-terminal domain-containing protein n=1 Tax=Dreissena polymorpha TaxID=45954 RepID=A0A9D4EEQ7_DREPO|nr:hypothetical protein DPMN_157059 [Dreissena polymorpha]